MGAIKNNNCIFLLLVILVISACSHSKTKPPQPVSKDITKTALQVGNKKDSVINNPQKNYGTATVPEPCVKCLLEVIQQSKSFKDKAGSLPASNINYTVNWVNAAQPAIKPDTSIETNGVRVDVKQIEDGEDKQLCSYVYNNVEGSMYLINDKNKLEHAVSNITPELLKRIRNSCYWGVASGK